MCKHWGKITYYGEDLSSEKYEWLKRVNCSKCCTFFKNKTGLTPSAFRAAKRHSKQPAAEEGVNE